MKQLTEEQQQRFSSAIKHGFITAEAPQNTHTFVWTWIKKHPNRVTTLVRLREIIGHAPRWEDITDDVISDLKDDMEFQMRSEEHTSELQSRQYLVCRLLLEKKNKNTARTSSRQWT